MVFVLMHYCRTYLSKSILKSALSVLSPRKLESLRSARVCSSPTSFPGEAPALDALRLFTFPRQYTRPHPRSRLRAQRDSACGSLNLDLLTKMSAVNPTSAFPPTDAQSSKGSLQAGSGASNAANVAKR